MASASVGALTVQLSVKKGSQILSVFQKKRVIEAMTRITGARRARQKFIAGWREEAFYELF